MAGWVDSAESCYCFQKGGGDACAGGVQGRLGGARRGAEWGRRGGGGGVARSGVHTMCSDTQKQFLNIQYNYNEYKTNDSSACPAALLASNAPTCMLCSATQRWPTNSTDRAARVRRTSPRRAGP